MTVYVPLEDGTLPEVEMGKQAQREPLALLPPVFSKRRMMKAIRCGQRWWGSRIETSYPK